MLEGLEEGLEVGGRDPGLEEPEGVAIECPLVCILGGLAGEF